MNGGRIPPLCSLSMCWLFSASGLVFWCSLFPSSQTERMGLLSNSMKTEPNCSGVESTNKGIVSKQRHQQTPMEQRSLQTKESTNKKASSANKGINKHQWNKGIYKQMHHQQTQALTNINGTVESTNKGINKGISKQRNRQTKESPKRVN